MESRMPTVIFLAGTPEGVAKFSFKPAYDPELPSERPRTHSQALWAFGGVEALVERAAWRLCRLDKYPTKLGAELTNIKCELGSMASRLTDTGVTPHDWDTLRTLEARTRHIARWLVHCNPAIFLPRFTCASEKHAVRENIVEHIRRAEQTRKCAVVSQKIMQSLNVGAHYTDYLKALSPTIDAVTVAAYRFYDATETLDANNFHAHGREALEEGLRALSQQLAVLDTGIKAAVGAALSASAGLALAHAAHGV